MAARFQIGTRIPSDSPVFLSRLVKACLLAVACSVMATSAGCGLMANAMYVVKGNDAPAEFDELKEKRVAVVVSNGAGMNADASSILMSRHISELFARNIKKVEMVNPEEVDRIINDQSASERTISAIGNRLRADYVVQVELSNLKLREGQTLYRGRCTSSVAAFKVSDGERAAFRKSFPEFVYPQHGAPITDFDEVTFQRIYLAELALRISRTFYPFDPSIDVAKDAAVSSLGALH